MGSHVEGSGERRGCAEGQTPGSPQSNDGDGDGVIDKFDKCPHTPEGKWVWTDQHKGRCRGCAPGEVPQW